MVSVPWVFSRTGRKPAAWEKMNTWIVAGWIKTALSSKQPGTTGELHGHLESSLSGFSQQQQQQHGVSPTVNMAAETLRSAAFRSGTQPKNGVKQLWCRLCFTLASFSGSTRLCGFALIYKEQNKRTQKGFMSYIWHCKNTEYCQVF